jgi:hypothetical protein
MQIRLRACEVEVTVASNAMQALWIAVNEAPDVMNFDALLDAISPYIKVNIDVWKAALRMRRR